MRGKASWKCFGFFVFVFVRVDGVEFCWVIRQALTFLAERYIDVLARLRNRGIRGNCAITRVVLLLRETDDKP